MNEQPHFSISTPAPMSVAQLAQRWGCSTGLVRKLIDGGSLKCFRLGNLIRIGVAEVERYEAGDGTNSEQEAPPPRTIPPKRRSRIAPRRLGKDERRPS